MRGKQSSSNLRHVFLYECMSFCIMDTCRLYGSTHIVVLLKNTRYQAGLAMIYHPDVTSWQELAEGLLEDPNLMKHYAPQLCQAVLQVSSAAGNVQLVGWSSIGMVGDGWHDLLSTGRCGGP